MKPLHYVIPPPRVTSYLLDQYILISTLFSNTLNLHFLHNVRGQVSYS
jgi:hypothetical protein